MLEIHTNEIAVVLDYKKNRIRIYKSTLRAIGDPQYIQILVNPEKRILGVHAANRDDRYSMAILLSQDWKDPENTYEVYSQYFLLKLAQLAGNINLKTNYRIVGTTLPAHGVALFPLDELIALENEEDSINDQDESPKA